MASISCPVHERPRKVTSFDTPLCGMCRTVSIAVLDGRGNVKLLPISTEKNVKRLDIDIRFYKVVHHQILLVSVLTSE